MNAAYMSPSLLASETAWVAGARRKSTPWEVAKPDFYDSVEQLRTATAKLIGAAPDCIALVPSASYGVAVAAANLQPRLSATANIVSLGGEHTSNRFVWQQMAAKMGILMKIVPPPTLLPPGVNWGNRVLEEIDANTAVVAVTPMFWLDGTRLPLELLAARCKEVGAALVVDATQCVGATPFDVNKIEVDFLVCAGYKWLLWPYGLGFLYAHPKWHGGNGVEQHGWADPEQKSGRGLAMWGLSGGENEYGKLDLAERKTARRLEMGGRPFLDAVPAALAATEQLLAWDPARIAATLAPLTANIAEAAVTRGYSVPTVRSDHFIGIKTGSDSAALVSRLWKHHRVHVSARGQCIRVSPHVYNSTHSVQRLFAALDVECAR